MVMSRPRIRSAGIGRWLREARRGFAGDVEQAELVAQGQLLVDVEAQIRGVHEALALEVDLVGEVRVDGIVGGRGPVEEADLDAAVGGFKGDQVFLRP